MADDADQSKYLKHQRVHEISLHLIGLICHVSTNKLRLFATINEHAKGSNHIIASIHHSDKWDRRKWRSNTASSVPKAR